MFRKWRQKRRLEREPLPAQWFEWIEAVVPQWRYLDDGEREQLLDDVRHLFVRPSWEAANGFTITDEMRVSIAAQAALLVLGLDDDDPYRNVDAIVVHPSTIHIGGEHHGVAGTYSDAIESMLGLTQFNGPVVIAWDEASRNARHPERGHNVVFHEFAHKLDMLDGLVNGTPPLRDDEQSARWREVCTAEFEALRAGEGGELLDEYGATDPGEFFAVATEVFFNRPVEMEEQKPELYDVLRGFYQQDPAARVRGAASI